MRPPEGIEIVQVEGPPGAAHYIVRPVAKPLAEQVIPAQGTE